MEKKILRAVGQAIGDFSLVGEGDRILVAISGGKDSWVMLDMLEKLRRKAPVRFELIAVNIDQGYKGFRQDIVEDYVNSRGFTFYMENYDIAGIIAEKAPDATPCSLCSRLRRGSLYGLAEKYNCNKIALGHHLDDFIETLLLNAFFSGKLAAMAPILHADDGRNVVIRPLVYVSEDDVRAYAQQAGYPIVCCQCPLACGEASQGDFKRHKIKQLLKNLESDIPHIKKSLLSSLGNVNPRHLLDRRLWEIQA